MRHIIKKGIVCVALAGASAVSAAQEGMLEEVIVTATKREQNLQDIPVSVNAISENTIQEAGINNIEGVAALVPSLSISSNLSPFSTAIRIRGFGTAQNDPSLEASVAFILDGVYMGRSGLGMSDLTDIERIEVLQGPQGTLYGKNSNAGVISVITKSPSTQETEGFVEASLGDYSLQKYVGSITGPISETLAYLVAGSWHQYDGWMESNTGDDLNSTDDWNARSKLLWQPTQELRVQLTASHVDRNTSCCAADAVQSFAVIDQLEAKGLPVPKNDAFDYRNNVDIDSNFDLTADAINATVDYDLSNGTLTSITAWNQYNYKSSYDADRSDLAVLGVVDDKYTGELWSQELRLASDLEGPLQYMAGLFYAYEERTRGAPGRGVVVVGDDMIAVGGAYTGLGPAFALGVQPGDTVVFDSKWKSDTAAVFGQVSYDISDAWVATLGLRYTSETKDADLNTQPMSSAPLFGTGRTFVEQAFTPIDEHFNRETDGVTGLANITWFMKEDVMLFASVSTGTKSGGFNGVTSEGASTEFKDEDTTNYELGVKSQLFHNTLQVNASAFHTEFDDLQFMAQQPNGVGFFVSNAAEATSTGVDVNFSATPWSFLMLSGGFQYLHAKYTQGDLKEADLDVPYAPDWSGVLSATFSLPLYDGMTYLRSDYSFMSDHYTNPTYQDSKTKQDKKLLNLRLGWRNDKWDVAFWVKNATDEAYSSISAAPVGITGTEAEFLEAPRTYGLTLRYSFAN